MSERKEYIRYGVVPSHKSSDDVIHWMPYEEERDARQVRKVVDKMHPDDAPHRVVKATITLEDIEP